MTGYPKEGKELEDLGEVVSIILLSLSRSRSGLAAVANAVVDALAEFSVEHIELPATAERIWSAIRTACPAK